VIQRDVEQLATPRPPIESQRHRHQLTTRRACEERAVVRRLFFGDRLVTEDDHDVGEKIVERILARRLDDVSQRCGDAVNGDRP
jgi:hypothetical protein